jgi:nucleoside phosphorylase
MGWDRPLYLHFLDRELGESVDGILNTGRLEAWLKCLLVGTACRFYCGLSLPWESPAAQGDALRLVEHLVAVGTLDTITNHASLDEFLASRQTLYAHDVARYPKYFALQEPLFIKPTRLSVVSTTARLAANLAGEFSGSAVEGRFRTQIARDVRTSVATALARREQAAVTFALFRPDLGSLAADPGVTGTLRRMISEAYTRHYMDVGGGDIPTGAAGLAWFDRLSLHFPDYDLPLLAALIESTTLGRYLTDPWRSHDRLWMDLSWRGRGIHETFRAHLRLLVSAAVQMSSRRHQDRDPLNVPSFDLVRQLALARLRSAAAVRRGRPPDVNSPDDIIEVALRELDEIRRDAQREMGFAATYERLRADAEGCDVLVVTATRIERDAFLDEAQRRGFGYSVYFGKQQAYFDLGVLGGARTFLVQSEMGTGTVGGSLATIVRSIDELAPRAVVMVGIAFGTRPDRQSIGNILVSQQLRMYESQRVGQDVDGSPLVTLRGDRVTASARLLGRMRASTRAWKGQSVEFGLLLTGEKLVDNRALRDQLLSLEPEATGGDMEAGGLYVAATERGTDWIVVKAICDWADGTKSLDKAARQDSAARSAAGFLVHALLEGGFGMPDSGLTV